MSPDPKVMRTSLSNKQVKLMLANSASQAAIIGRSSLEIAAKGMVAAGRVSPKQLQLKQASVDAATGEDGPKRMTSTDIVK